MKGAIKVFDLRDIITSMCGIFHTSEIFNIDRLEDILFKLKV